MNDRAFALIDAKLVRGGYVVALHDLDVAKIVARRWQYAGDGRLEVRTDPRIGLSDIVPR